MRLLLFQAKNTNIQRILIYRLKQEDLLPDEQTVPAAPCPTHSPADDLNVRVALDVSSLPALHIHSISESLPFALLTTTLILPHNLALKSFLSSVIPPLNASFYHFPTLQG